MNEVKKLVEELRNKKSRDNRDLLDRSADMIERLAIDLCEKSGCHHKCNDTKDCVVEDEAREYLHSALTNEEKVSEKDKLLLINENKSNNSGFKSNNFDVKSNNELFKQALVEGVNRRIDKTIEEAKKIEQIEEMAYEMTQYKGKMCERIEHNKCLLKFHTHAFINCNYCKLAEHLITEKNYRKQSEGEWLTDRFGLERSICSVCGAVFEGEGGNFCPFCGAKMKGGVEE